MKQEWKKAKKHVTANLISIGLILFVIRDSRWAPDRLRTRGFITDLKSWKVLKA